MAKKVLFIQLILVLYYNFASSTFNNICDYSCSDATAHLPCRSNYISNDVCRDYEYGTICPFNYEDCSMADICDECNPHYPCVKVTSGFVQCKPEYYGTCPDDTEKCFFTVPSGPDVPPPTSISPSKSPTTSPIKEPTISPVKEPTLSPSLTPTKVTLDPTTYLSFVCAVAFIFDTKSIVLINLETGDIIASRFVGYRAEAIAVNKNTMDIYVISRSSALNELYRYDISLQSEELIGFTQVPTLGLDYNENDDYLYAVYNSNVYRINPNTGNAVDIGDNEAGIYKTAFLIKKDGLSYIVADFNDGTLQMNTLINPTVESTMIIDWSPPPGQNTAPESLDYLNEDPFDNNLIMCWGLGSGLLSPILDCWIYDLDTKVYTPILQNQDLQIRGLEIVPGTTCLSLTGSPTKATAYPTSKPTDRPTNRPTNRPTYRPTDRPTYRPTDMPTGRPTDKPTDRPTDMPSSSPTSKPTDKPTDMPSSSPTKKPIDEATDMPSSSPTSKPTDKPTDMPSSSPTLKPTDKPTDMPSASPTVDICADCNIEYPCTKLINGKYKCFPLLLDGSCQTGATLCITGSPTKATGTPTEMQIFGCLTTIPPCLGCLDVNTGVCSSPGLGECDGNLLDCRPFDDPPSVAPTTSNPTESPVVPIPSPTRSPVSICDGDCNSATFGLPCRHTNFGDRTCHPYMSIGGCPPGTIDCDEQDPCLFCTTALPCLHDGVDNNACFATDANGFCFTGTTRCTRFGPPPPNPPGGPGPSPIPTGCENCNTCVHDIDGTCFPFNALGNCYPGTTPCPPQDRTCADCPGGCTHDVDGTCFPRNSNGDCFAGTSPCGPAIPPSNTCDSCGECVHDTAGTCVARVGGICLPGTTPCDTTVTTCADCLGGCLFGNQCFPRDANGNCFAGTTPCDPASSPPDTCASCDACVNDITGLCIVRSGGICLPGTTPCDPPSPPTCANCGTCINTITNECVPLIGGICIPGTISCLPSDPCGSCTTCVNDITGQCTPTLGGICIPGTTACFPTPPVTCATCGTCLNSITNECVPLIGGICLPGTTPCISIPTPNCDTCDGCINTVTNTCIPKLGGLCSAGTIDCDPTPPITCAACGTCINTITNECVPLLGGICVPGTTSCIQSDPVSCATCGTCINTITNQCVPTLGGICLPGTQACFSQPTPNCDTCDGCINTVTNQCIPKLGGLCPGGTLDCDPAPPITCATCGTCINTVTNECVPLQGGICLPGLTACSTPDCSTCDGCINTVTNECIPKLGGLCPGGTFDCDPAPPVTCATCGGTCLNTITNQCTPRQGGICIPGTTDCDPQPPPSCATCGTCLNSITNQCVPLIGGICLPGTIPCITLPTPNCDTCADCVNTITNQCVPKLGDICSAGLIDCNPTPPITCATCGTCINPVTNQCVPLLGGICLPGTTPCITLPTPNCDTCGDCLNTVSSQCVPKLGGVCSAGLIDCNPTSTDPCANCNGCAFDGSCLAPTNGQCLPGTTQCFTTSPDPCDSCSASAPCIHNVDNTCLPELAPGICYPGSTRCSNIPTQPPADDPDVPAGCGSCDRCLFNGACIDPSAPGVCTPGTLQCFPTTPIDPCDSCTSLLPCSHNVDGTCLAIVAGACTPGSTLCPGITPATPSPVVSVDPDPCGTCDRCLFNGACIDPSAPGICTPGTITCFDTTITPSPVVSVDPDPCGTCDRCLFNGVCIDPIQPGLCTPGTITCFDTTPTTPPNPCDLCTPLLPCSHDIDGTCLVALDAGAQTCFPGSTLCPGIIPATPSPVITDVTDGPTISPTIFNPGNPDDEPTISPTTSPVSPTQSPTRVCDKTCSPTTFGLPCIQETPGDDTCRNKINGQCPAGTRDCTLDDPCDACTLTFPCLHNVDQSCLGAIPQTIPTLCFPGTTLCPGLTPEPTARPTTAIPTTSPFGPGLGEGPCDTCFPQQCADGQGGCVFPLPTPGNPIGCPPTFPIACFEVAPPEPTKSPTTSPVIPDEPNPCDICSISKPCLCIHPDGNYCYDPYGPFCAQGDTLCFGGPNAKIEAELKEIKQESQMNKEMITLTLIMSGLVSFIVGVLCLGSILFIAHKCGCKCINCTRKSKGGFTRIDTNDSEVTTSTDIIQQ